MAKKKRPPRGPQLELAGAVSVAFVNTAERFTGTEYSEVKRVIRLTGKEPPEVERNLGPIGDEAARVKP